MTDKPPVPAGAGHGWPVTPLDETDPDYQQLIRIAASAAYTWTLTPANRSWTMSRAGVARGQIAEGVALLLELGVIDIDRERLAAWAVAGMPMNRRRVTP